MFVKSLCMEDDTSEVTVFWGLLHILWSPLYLPIITEFSEVLMMDCFYNEDIFKKVTKKEKRLFPLKTNRQCFNRKVEWRIAFQLMRKIWTDILFGFFFFFCILSIGENNKCERRRWKKESKYRNGGVTVNLLMTFWVAKCRRSCRTRLCQVQRCQPNFEPQNHNM